jgi:hypothetical protein
MGYAVPEPEDWPGGLIRGVVRVAGTVEEHWSEWFGGPIGWLIGDPIVLATPVACRGRKKLWRLPPEARGLVVGQLRAGSVPVDRKPSPREGQSEGGRGGCPPQICGLNCRLSNEGLG